MKDKKQIEIRREKCGYDWSDEQREKVSEEKTKDSYKIAKKIILKERGRFCERCGKELGEKKVVIHHKNGRRWDNNLDNLQILCSSCHSKIHNEIGKVSHRFAGLATIENYIAEMLKRLGVDLDDPNFIETPLRVARMYNEFFEGLRDGTEKEIKDTLSSVFPSNVDLMIVEQDIELYSLCPHHLLPVVYKVNIGYIPNGKVIGVSKLVRVANLIFHKPVLQEDATQELADAIYKYLKPQGVMVFVKGQHFCMVMRGVRTKGWVTTSAIKGAFKEEPEAKEEFLKLIQI